MSDFMAWVRALDGPEATFWGAAVGIAGGLTAIVLGALLNAFLNRLRDDRIRLTERQSIAAGLYAEIKSAKHTIERQKNQLEQKETSPDNTKVQPSVPKIPIYEANCGNIGIIGSDVVIPIVIFYEGLMNWRAFTDKQAQILSQFRLSVANHIAQADAALTALSPFVPDRDDIAKPIAYPEDRDARSKIS